MTRGKIAKRNEQNSIRYKCTKKYLGLKCLYLFLHSWTLGHWSTPTGPRVQLNISCTYYPFMYELSQINIWEFHKLSQDGSNRRKLILIEANAKCRHLKNWSEKGTLQQVFICLRPRTLGVGGGRGVETVRRIEGQQFTKLCRNYQHDWLYLQSINSDKHLPQSTFTGQFF